jgi:hypothetical protein
MMASVVAIPVEKQVHDRGRPADQVTIVRCSHLIWILVACKRAYDGSSISAPEVA